MTRRRSATCRRAAVLVLLATALAAGCGEAEMPHNGAPAPVDPREAAAPEPQSLPTATILVGSRPLVVEVADEEAERQLGMMGRRSLGEDEAMLFVFPQEAPLSFWMKHCYVDLDLGYIRADGTLAEVHRMRAHDKRPVRSRAPVKYALEVPAGWFGRHGYGPGTTVTIPPSVAAN